MGGKSDVKAAYFDKLRSLLEGHKSIFVVSVDNVSSQQMHEIRQSLRGEGIVLMGKNTMVRSIILSSIPVLTSSLGPSRDQGMDHRAARL